MSKSHLYVVGAGIAAVVVAAWMGLRAPKPAPMQDPATTLEATIVTTRTQIARAHAEVVAKQPARTIVMPDHPPPPGVPAWATRLPNQR